MKTSTLLVATTVVAAAAFPSMCCRPVQAATQTPPPAPTTVGATCQAAHEADSRVSATFCSTLLREDANAPADTCFLADSAAAEGVWNANAARKEIVAEIQRQDDHENDPIYRALLTRCEDHYSVIEEKYDAARQAIEDQKYGDVQEELSSVPSRAQSCDDEWPLIRGGGASPYLKYSEDNTQIALLTVAITSLIK